MQSKNSSLHKNVFTGGLNKDIAKGFIDNEQYFDAQNLSLVDNNKFLSLQNIKGTTFIDNIIEDNDVEVLGVAASKYTIGDIENVDCLTIWTAKEGDTINIFCYDLDNEILYELFEQITPDDYLTGESRSIDGFLYPENGLDIIYFTDFYNEFRKLRCYIPSTYTPNFLDEFDLSLTRRGAVGPIEISSLEDGGSVLSGTYQFAYQLIVPGSNKYTKFSLLSLPFQVFNTDSAYPYSGIGVSTDKKLLINIYPSEEELASYTHFRLAVIENIYPEGTTVTEALLTETVPLSNYLVGGVISNYPFSSNLRSNTYSVPIDEIVVDLAALEAVKTITVRENRLIGGNIKYKDLSYDNGDPIITGGEVLKESVDTSNSVDGISYNTGHFRNEVYRYAISYFDEFDNFSPPKTLDLSSVTGNQINVNLTYGSNLITNGTFTGGISGWSQMLPADGNTQASTWTYASNQISVSITPGPNFESKIFYQTGLSFTKTKARLTYTVVAGGPIFSLRTLNGTTILGGAYLDSTIGTHTQIIDIPNTCDGIGFFVGPQFATATLTLDNVILEEVNENVTSFFDMKFPSRSTVVGSDTYTLLDSNDYPINLGLFLTGISNHPTWAKGFIILRVKRIKDIIWQSPLVPMVSVYGLGALDNYPIQAIEQNPLTTVDYASAQPMGPNTTYFPMNYFYEKLRSIGKSTTNSGSGLSTRKAGEVQYVRHNSTTDDQSLCLVFPNQTMYSENSKYVFNEGHQLESIDSALLTLKGYKYNSATDIASGGGLGNFLNTSVSGTFYSHESGNYYYDFNHGGVKTDIRSDKFKIKGYRDFDNLAEGFVLNGKEIFNKENLVTDTVSWDGIDGQNTQRGAVVDLSLSGGPFGSVSSEAGNAPNLSYASGSKMAWRSSNVFANFTSLTPLDGINEVEIVNCVANLNNDRYGAKDSFHEFIYTGTKVVFTEAEQLVVQAGGDLPKDVEVWGGDCRVTKHIFKISDTCYGIENGSKSFGSGETSHNLVSHWTRYFKIDNSNPDCGIMIPIPFKNCAQYIEVYLESEYNGELVENRVFDNTGTFSSPKIITAESSCRTPLIYGYNINVNKENDQKIFVSQDLLLPNVIRNKARLVYSDKKIYQSGIEGFDIFRVLNYYDLDETYGGINKLSTIGNDLYSLQDSGITYIGIGERSLEQTDGGFLSVRTGDVIGTVILVDTRRGCQDLSSVVNTGKTLYFVDQRNKSVYGLADKSLAIISDNGMQSEFRNILSNSHISNELLGLYDPLRKEYWCISKTADTCYVFNENYNKWVSNYEFASNLHGGAFTNKNLYLIGNGSDIDGPSVHSMYTGESNTLFGVVKEPSVTFITNPQNEFGKTFDEILIVASDTLGSLDLTVNRESSLGDQTVTDIALNTLETRGEGNYRLKTLFDANDSRLRGNHLVSKIKWSDEADSLQVNLTSVVTKFRPSENIF